MVGFVAYEDIAIGVPNPMVVIKTGSPEGLERLLAFALQSGLEVEGITEEERKKYLEMDFDI